MNRANITLTSTVVAAALGLALGLSAPPAEANHDCTPGTKFEDHPHCTGGGASGGGESGKAQALVVTLDSLGTPTSITSIVDDGLGDYFNKDGGVTTRVGGESQPNRPGLGMNLKGTGKNFRTVKVAVGCTNPLVGGIYIGGINGCTNFQTEVNNLERDPVFGVQRAKVNLAVRPYEVNCPDPLINDQCRDVFTMGALTAQMSFRTAFYEQILFEIASDIGGASAPNPGRCLSLLSDDERDAYLDRFCKSRGQHSAEDCNVTVTANFVDSDGRNNDWTIMAANDTGLICSLASGAVFIIGVAENVSFMIEAVVEE